MRTIRTASIATTAIGLLLSVAVGATAQSDPVEVTGQMEWSGPSGVIETWTTSDERLDGEGRWSPSEGHPSQAFDYFLNGRTLENEGGVWRQLPMPTVNFPGQSEIGVTDLVLVGEGGYDGLVFVGQGTWTENGFKVHGYIVDKSAP